MSTTTEEQLPDIPPILWILLMMIILAILGAMMSCKSDVQYEKMTMQYDPIPYPDSDSKYYNCWISGYGIPGHIGGHYELREIPIK